VAVRVRDALPGARLVPAQGCPRLTFSADRRLEHHVSAEDRRTVRRGRSRIAGAGVRARVDRIREPATVRDLLPEIVAMHRGRDHALGRRSDLDAVSRRTFYIEVSGQLADAGLLDIWTLRLDDAIGAFMVGIRDGAVYRIWDGRIDTRWRHCAPGRVLRTDVLTALLADPGLTEVDWMRGELQHKMDSATRVVAAEDLLAESSTAVAAAVRGVAAARRAVRDRVPAGARRWVRTTGSALSQPAERFRSARARPGAERGSLR
jgi:CelD/BcsL family acetyltransferase involved in cellulose biosynthesis